MHTSTHFGETWDADVLLICPHHSDGYPYLHVSTCLGVYFSPLVGEVTGTPLPGVLCLHLEEAYTEKRKVRHIYVAWNTPPDTYHFSPFRRYGGTYPVISLGIR